MSRIIGYKTYKYFAQKYGIKLSSIINGKRKLKNMTQLSEEIFKYETENIDYIPNNQEMLHYY